MNKELLTALKESFDNKSFEINGKEYGLTNTTHVHRLKVFSYFSKIQKKLEINDYSFITDKEYRDVEELISKIITFYLCFCHQNGAL